MDIGTGGALGRAAFVPTTTFQANSGGGLTITAGKTLTAINSITIGGTDTHSLDIGNGGTLGTAAFTAASAYQPANSILTGIVNNTGKLNLTGMIVLPREDIRAGQFYDDFRGSDTSPYTGPAPSGQTYTYLTAARGAVTSKELVPASMTASAYYMQTIPGDPIRNFGCTGTFVTGPGSHTVGHRQGVFILTSTADAGVYLPSNFLHIRWFFNQLIVEGTNTGIAGPPGLIQIAVLPFNSPIGEETTLSFVLEGNKLTVAANGYSTTLYSSYFSESTWGTLAVEDIGSELGVGNEIEAWRFHRIWANAPNNAIAGETAQPRSDKLGFIATGRPDLAGIPALASSNTFTSDIAVGGAVVVTGRIDGNGGVNVADGRSTRYYGLAHSGGVSLYGSSALWDTQGGALNWARGQPGAIVTNDFGVYRSAAAGTIGLAGGSGTGQPNIPFWYFDGTSGNNRTTIGWTGTTQPTGTATLNVNGTLVVSTSASIPKLSNLGTNGLVYVNGGNGTLNSLGLGLAGQVPYTDGTTLGWNYQQTLAPQQVILSTTQTITSVNGSWTTILTKAYAATSSTAKVRLTANINAATGAGTAGGAFAIQDGGTTILAPTAVGSGFAAHTGMNDNGSANVFGSYVIDLVYTPGNSASHTYTVVGTATSGGSGTIYINRSGNTGNAFNFNGVSTFTVQEIP